MVGTSLGRQGLTSESHPAMERAAWLGSEFPSPEGSRSKWNIQEENLERVGICICITDSLCCTAETNGTF